jgi:hypothetical protein
MAKHKSNKTRSNRESRRLRLIYAKARREFSAADLQIITVVEKGVPLDKLITAMQRIQSNSKYA